MREAELGLCRFRFKGHACSFSTLNCEMFVLQEHFGRRHKLVMTKTVREDLNSLNHNKVGNS